MKYIAIFDVPDNQVIYKGRPALLFSHSEDSEVITVTVANEIHPIEGDNNETDIQVL